MFRARTAAVLAGAALAAGVFFTPGHAEPTSNPVPAAAAKPAPAGPLVVHEWGTFTSFSGSNGVPTRFQPNNDDLPNFMYRQEGDPNSKARLLHRDGTISMETPVIYFYTQTPTRATVKVDFPGGWITEWYPFADTAPVAGRQHPKTGQTIKWDVRLMPGEAEWFPHDRNKANPYYFARETDAVPLQAEVIAGRDRGEQNLQGGFVVQREKFLFYRGVATFDPGVRVEAVGGGRVVVRNPGAAPVDGVFLVNVRGGKVGFTQVGTLAANARQELTIPAAGGTSAELGDAVVKSLTGAGLYEKEARAMVKSWDHAWFGEEGTRVLYLVPRARTDELLPLTVEPKPTEVVRVLVGRHDFLTPEQEADADTQVARIRAAYAELDAAQKRLGTVGRFSNTAREQAEKRVDARAQK